VNLRVKTVLIALAVPVILCGSCTTFCALNCGPYALDARLGDAPRWVRDGVLLGLTSSELDARVGRQSPRSFSGWDRAYFLHSQQSCVDSVWLVVHFGPDGRVDRAAITND
jgi:hypothetical protein